MFTELPALASLPPSEGKENASSKLRRGAGKLAREDNKLRMEDRAAHDLFRSVLSYPAHIVRTYVERFALDSEHDVLDPFCGTGTTIVECKKLGIASCGIEPNPMAVFASRTKVDWKIAAEILGRFVARNAKVASKTEKP